jgi:hypothetical protein
VRDVQRQKVYDWERGVVKPRCPKQVAFKDAQMVVDGVWLAEGLLNPPKVEPLSRATKRAAAMGNRLSVWLNPDEPTPTWVILHEIAHALTMTHEGHTDQHGPAFVGVYMNLLVKYLDVPLPLLLYAAQKDGVKFDLFAKPAFLDRR